MEQNEEETAERVVMHRDGELETNLNLVTIAIGMTSATIFIPYYESEYRLMRIEFGFYNDALKLKLLCKLLDINGSIIDWPITYFLDYIKIPGDILALMILLAPIDILADGGLKKTTEEYHDGTIELKNFKQEVVAYCVSGKLSE